MQTSRGCPFECEFCDVIVYLGRRQRHKQPARVVDELEQLYQAGYRSVFLSDDNFTANRRRAAEIMAAVGDWNRSKPQPVALYTQLSIDVTRDQDLPLLDLCAEAGLKQAFVGIETPNPDALREVHKRQNLRSDLIDDVHRIQRRGIMVQAGMITGFDSDTLESFGLMYEFLQAAGIPMVLLAMLNALDGTPLQQRLADEGRLKGLLLSDAALDTNIVPKQMSQPGAVARHDLAAEPAVSTAGVSGAPERVRRAATSRFRARGSGSGTLGAGRAILRRPRFRYAGGATRGGQALPRPRHARAAHGPGLLPQRARRPAPLGSVGSAAWRTAGARLSERRVTERSAAEIEAWLLTRLRERLGSGAEEIDAHLPFSYYGLDSLDAIALAAELEEWLGVPVTPDVAWDHPTAHAVATYLGSERPVEAAPDVDEATVAALLAELDAAEPDN